MTIASEIERLQEAKADIKSSIEWKWVSVPSSAKLDVYSEYIDQINTWDAFMDSLRLAWYVVSWKDAKPAIIWFISWKEWNVYYWCSLIWLRPWDVSDTYVDLVWIKKTSWSDVVYSVNEKALWGKSIFSIPRWVYFYKKNWAIRVFFYSITSYTSNYVFWYQADWDYINDTMSIVVIQRNEDHTHLPPEADTTWYTLTSDNLWIKSIDWDDIDYDAYIYITTK